MNEEPLRNRRPFFVCTFSPALEQLTRKLLKHFVHFLETGNLLFTRKYGTRFGSLVPFAENDGNLDARVAL